MRYFPKLTIWFEISGYYEHQRCKTISLLLKDNLTNDEIDEFAREFAKLICRIRCNYRHKYGDDDTDLCAKFQDAIDGNIILSDEEKTYLSVYIFFHGIVSQKKYDETNNFVDSIDRELFNGYFGEVLFYVIREQLLEDEKIMIEPSKPKEYSKQSGLDYIEIRKSVHNNEYYFIIGEVKTTENTIGNYPNEIITSLKKRPKHLIAFEANAFKERIKHTDNEDLKLFVDKIPRYFVKKDPQKKFAGVINYGRSTAHRESVFENFYPECGEHLDESNDCRRVKLVGIENIENLKERVLGFIWRNLSV